MIKTAKHMLRHVSSASYSSSVRRGGVRVENQIRRSPFRSDCNSSVRGGVGEQNYTRRSPFRYYCGSAVRGSIVNGYHIWRWPFHYCSSAVRGGVVKAYQYHIRMPPFCYCCNSAVRGGDEVHEEGNHFTEMDAEINRLTRMESVEVLKEKLGRIDREWISYSELLEACKSSGVALSAAEASSFARVLHEAGVIYIFRNKIFLQPTTLINIFRKAMPSAYMLDQDQCRAEYLNLEKEMLEIVRKARKYVICVLWISVIFMFGLVGSFCKLIIWDLSWDLVEPIVVCMTALGMALSHTYFVITSQYPSYQNLAKRLLLCRKRKLIKRQKFDVNRLLELRKRYKVEKKKIVVELEPEDL